MDDFCRPGHITEQVQFGTYCTFLGKPMILMLRTVCCTSNLFVEAFKATFYCKLKQAQKMSGDKHCNYTSHGKAKHLTHERQQCNMKMYQKYQQFYT